jgi:site-specific recombinase XerC
MRWWRRLLELVGAYGEGFLRHREVRAMSESGGRRPRRVVVVDADNPLVEVFPTTTGRRLSRDAVEHRLARHLAPARANCSSLRAKHVTMHTLRHTAAMRLLIAGNDITVIALWLGHEQVATTNIYLHADMTHKQEAIDRTHPLAGKPGRYRPPDALLTFLESL